MRQILSVRGLTLNAASRRSAEIFGRPSEYFIPHKLYHYLEHPILRPTIGQVLALSHITNYRFADWLKVLGFDLDRIPRLQLLIPRRQTTLLDSTVYDTEAWIPWFAERPDIRLAPAIHPLATLLTRSRPRRASNLLALNEGKFIYALVGYEDSYAFPCFVPRSVIRADPRPAEAMLSGAANDAPDVFFLVEHDSGWTCSRLVLLGNDRVLLRCPLRPSAWRELRIGKNARILGAVDAEIRPVAHLPEPLAPPATLRRMPRAPSSSEPASLANVLRRSRHRAGLSFREASSISRVIADSLSDELHFAAASTLSDFEALSKPPRHIQQIVTLCVLYSIGFYEFLRAAKLPLNLAGQEPVPDKFVGRQAAEESHPLRLPVSNGGEGSGSFLTGLIHRWQEVPLFLRPSLDPITGLKDFSLSDVFWVGDDTAQRHPLLVNADFVIVNRRARTPRPTGDAVCDESLYVILGRGGAYSCGRCTLDGDEIVLRGYPGDPAGTRQFKNGAGAEIVGQVTTIVRKGL